MILWAGRLLFAGRSAWARADQMVFQTRGPKAVERAHRRAVYLGAAYLGAAYLGAVYLGAV
jgi:hypothetical protein